VLVVEDERIERLLLTGLLQRAGCIVQTASTGAEAVRLCSRQTFDLVTLDWFLPDATGSEVLARLRKLPRHGTTPVIGITMLEEAAECGALTEFIRKPIDLEALMGALRRSGVPVRTQART
jgi:CheY-like chemotaxis protein